MILTILQWPDPRLTTPCTPVGDVTPALLQLADDMLKTMYAANGRGLAAPQVGVMQCVFVMDSGWKAGPRGPRVFFNPLILRENMPAERAVNTEACLSIPDRTVRISRPATVRLTWRDAAGQSRVGDFQGFEAVCVQHEIDHLNGILCIDYPEVADPAAGAAE